MSDRIPPAIAAAIDHLEEQCAKGYSSDAARSRLNTLIAELAGRAERVEAELKPHRDREDWIRRNTDPTITVSVAALSAWTS